MALSIARFHQLFAKHSSGQSRRPKMNKKRPKTGKKTLFFGLFSGLTAFAKIAYI